MSLHLSRAVAARVVSEHKIEMNVPPDRALRAVEEAAELWGAAWEPGISGGRIALPVVAGVRRSVLRGEMSVSRQGAGSSVELRITGEELRSVNRPALLILLLGGAGGVAATLWPFYPALLAVAPVAVVLALAAWLLVASRLRTSGPQDFLELVASLPDAPTPGNGTPPASGPT